MASKKITLTIIRESDGQPYRQDIEAVETLGNEKEITACLVEAAGEYTIEELQNRPIRLYCFGVQGDVVTEYTVDSDKLAGLTEDNLEELISLNIQSEEFKIA